MSRSLARVPWGHEVEVLLDLPVDRAARRLPPTIAELVEADGGTLLRMRVDSLDWMAGTLASLGCSFEIRSPGGAPDERPDARRPPRLLGLTRKRSDHSAFC